MRLPIADCPERRGPFALALALALALWFAPSAHAQPMLQSTAYTRGLLIQATAAACRAYLGITNMTFGNPLILSNVLLVGSPQGFNWDTNIFNLFGSTNITVQGSSSRLPLTNVTLSANTIKRIVSLGSPSVTLTVDPSLADEFSLTLTNNLTLGFALATWSDGHNVRLRVAQTGNFILTITNVAYWYPNGNSTQVTNNWGAGKYNSFSFWKDAGSIYASDKEGSATGFPLSAANGGTGSDLSGSAGGAMPFFDFASGKFISTRLAYTNGIWYEPTLGFLSIAHTNNTGDLLLNLGTAGAAGPSIQGYADKFVVANTNLTLDAVGPYSVRLRVNGLSVLDAGASSVVISNRLSVQEGTQTSPVIVGKELATGYGLVSLNGADALTTAAGMLGGNSDAHLYYLAPTGGGHQFRVNNVDRAVITDTGLVLSMVASGNYPLYVTSSGSLANSGLIYAGIGATPYFQMLQDASSNVVTAFLNAGINVGALTTIPAGEVSATGRATAKSFRPLAATKTPSATPVWDLDAQEEETMSVTAAITGMTTSNRADGKHKRI